jgi:4'-phosphopantetheinyl transferase
MGIDVERIDRNYDFASITCQFFTPAEQAALHASRAHERCNFFFQLWTCKESLLKAMGDDFQRSSTSISLTVQGDGEFVTLEFLQDQTEAKRWSTRMLLGITGCAAAITVEQ